jgi:Domain of Unknown Function (DUF1206)
VRTVADTRTRATGHGADAFELAARAGFVARGVVYVVIGILAIELATGSAGKPADQRGALQAIAAQPFGKVLLALVAAGLAFYACWRFVRAARGRGREQRDSGFDRVAAGASGVAYAVTCAIAVKILAGSSQGASSPKKEASGVFGWPGGTWLVGLAGVILIGVALYQLYRGLSTEFLEDGKTEQMSPAGRRAYEIAAIFGHVARAVAFGLTGVFLIRAAVEYDPSKAVGLDGALTKLAHASYGPALLGVVAAGLIAFGLYSVADARYRKV